MNFQNCNIISPTISGADFIDTKPEFVFEPGSKAGDTDCIHVQIVDDSVIESDESMWLSLVESEAVSVDKGPHKTALVIEDNEGMWLLTETLT